VNILILNAHWGNRGDEAAIRAMIDSLREQLPVNKMRIMLLGPGAEELPYDDIERLEYYPFFQFSVDRREALLNLFTLGRFSLYQRGRQFLRAVDKADVVIHAPGGPTIGDLNGMGDMQYLYRLLVAKVFKKKPLFFYAPSMGPFSGRVRNWARKFVLKRADAIILREDISRGYLKNQLGLDAYVTLDSAFQNDVPDDYLEKYGNIAETLQLIEGTRTVGLVVTDLKGYLKYSESQRRAQPMWEGWPHSSKYLIDRG